MGFGGSAPQSALLSRPMALTFVCQACGTRMQALDAAGVPVTKCSKCWSANLKPEGMPGEPGAPEGAPAAPPPVPPFPPEVLEMFDRFMTATERSHARREERCAALDEAEEDRRERVTVAATNALEALAELARVGTAYLKTLAKVG